MKTFTFPDAPCRQLEIHLHAMVWNEAEGIFDNETEGFRFLYKSKDKTISL